MFQTWKPELTGRRQGSGSWGVARIASFGDPLTRSAGAALLCGAFTQRLASRQSELFSENLCWALLPIVFKVARQQPDAEKYGRALPSVNKTSRAIAHGNPSAASLWLVSLSIVLCSLFRAENGIIKLFPALTPLLIIGQRYCRLELYPSGGPHPSLFSRLTDIVFDTALIAIFAIVALSEWDFSGYAMSAIPVAALFVAYTLLTPRTDKRSHWLQSLDFESAIRPLSLHVVAITTFILGVELILFGFSNSNIMLTLTLGLAKALTWYYTFQVVRHSSWLTASVIETFSILSARDPFTQHSSARALMNVVASLLALGQAIHLLPKHAKAKSILWAFSLVPLLPYFANLIAIHFSQLSTVVDVQRHPVEILIREAKSDFEGLLQKQSKTYSTAHDEYQRRYGLEPPPGFKEWYNFAQLHQSPVIDEFDMIYDSISPFLKMSGQEVLETMRQAYSEPHSELWRCTISKHAAETQCTHPWRTFDRHIGSLFDRVVKRLPGGVIDVSFLVNHLDEPRVIVPPSSLKSNQLNFTELSRQPTWGALTQFCSSRKRAVSTERRAPVETFGLPFVTNHKSIMDLCEHPEYSKMHGFALSPTSFRLIEGFVPILSTGSLSTMGDILYPSSAYIESEFQYDDSHDMEWDKKQNDLYWAGSNTGGYAVDETWRNYHRQRFVELAQNLKNQQHSYIREKDGVVSRVVSSFLNSRLYDVAFTRIFQCETRFCRDQRAYFAGKPWADKDRALRSRLVFDLDGNGISGRYYKLLASKSVPLKQTLFREWHDERLVPWVHYVPVSQSLKELPELVFYLTSTESGQLRAREIADQGRRWFSEAFREVDMAIYMYRLLLELARLHDPNRPALPADAE
ncbi:glycosyltransferase family 90 protein [Xylariaceae sp. FL1651]|nr:glycosyltransferase family 90 protein [Xylariaceae sp. FL1651]